MGVLSAELLLPVRRRLLPLIRGVEALRGADEPKPTGVMRGAEALPPPDLMLDDLRTEAPLGLSSEFRLTLEPVREGGREPPREPGAALLRRKDIISSP